jgi:hypothetical protein
MAATDARSSTLRNEQLSKLGTALSSAAFRPFLATVSRAPRSGTQITVHVARECITSGWSAFSRSITRDISRRISALDPDASVQVKLHSRSALDAPRSLEALIAKFGGERIYDPTGAFAEAETLMGFARELRRRMTDEVKGIYWSSRWRTAYVVLDRAALADGWNLRRDRLIAAERAVFDAYESNAADSRSDAAHRSSTVRLCFDLPGLPLVPVDSVSIAREHASKQRKVPRLLELAWLSRMPLLGAVFSLGTAGMAAAKLPVDNGAMPPAAWTTASTAGSGVAQQGGAADHGAAVSPGDQGDPFVGGPGLHSFWRDPVHGAVGQNPSSDMPAVTPRTGAAAALADTVTSQQFAEVARSAATFGRAIGISHGSLDLSWLAGAADGSPAVRAALMQPGIAAVLGLSGLMQGNPSEEAYQAALEDVELHFGLPRSLQREARWHFEGTPGSTDVGGGSYRDDAGKVLEARKPKRTRGSSA